MDPQNCSDEYADGTLGGLLYAGREKPVAVEQEWVDLVDAIAARDQSALQDLYARAHRVVFTLVMRITNSREDAEELTVDVFHDVWRRAAAYDPASGTVLAWIMNQARSRAIDRLRLDSRKKRVNPYPHGPAPHAVDRELHEVPEVSEHGHLLHHALSGLSRDERQAIETAYFSEMTYAETAASLNEPVGTIKTRIRSGLGKLRQALAGGGTPT